MWTYIKTSERRICARRSSHIQTKETMAQSREDRIYLAYKATKASFHKQGLDKVHGRTLIFLAKTFNVNPISIQQLVNSRRDENVKAEKK